MPQPAKNVTFESAIRGLEQLALNGQAGRTRLRLSHAKGYWTITIWVFWSDGKKGGTQIRDRDLGRLMKRMRESLAGER